MSLFGAFLSHEATTQLRSARFRITAIAYAALAFAPAVAVAIVASRNDFIAGPATFAAAITLFQPMLTTLFAGALSIDAIARERDESSFSVVSLAPISATGYVLRRWLALVVLAAPVTMLPQLAGAALAAYTQRSAGGLMPFAWTWLLQVLPVLLVMSATMLALGTITGRPILAVLAFGAGLPIVLGVLQDVLSYAHRKLDGPGRFLSFDEMAVQRLVWSIRGYWSLPIASESGFPVEMAFDEVLPGALVASAAAIALLGIAPAFLRRTKRDVRPWRIREDHPLRTFLKTLNRIREEYSLDAGRQRADVAMLAIALILAGGALTTLFARQSHFNTLAAQRFAGEQIEAHMAPSLVTRSARIEGTLARTIDTRATYVIENRGPRPESHLAFTLHPLLECGDPSRRFRITRHWDRISINLNPPIASGETRTIVLEMKGTPDSIDFSLIGGGSFHDRYNRYRRATTTVELSDLSRSRILPAASRDRMLLAASDFMPVPRYASPNDPPVRIETNLRTNLPAADSCGSTGQRLNGRCAVPLTTYTVAAARTKTLPLAQNTTLLHLERHDELARMHAPGLAEALSMAERAWPGIVSSRGIFFERPTEPGERLYRGDTGIRSAGVLHLVPETLFVRREPMQPGVIAASIVSGALLARRNVAPDQQFFFKQFFEEAARARLGGESRSAVVGRQMNPSTDPLLAIGTNFASQARLRGVLADLEYRAGADHVAAGIDDFLKMPGEGNGRQLVDAIARRAGTTLDRFYADYFAGEALPRLTFENVAFMRTADGWEARGALRNEGTGEVFCPVILRTEHGSIKRVIRVDSKEAVAFVIPTPHAPRTLQLDPDRVCYRVSMVGLVDSVEYRGAS